MAGRPRGRTRVHAEPPALSLDRYRESASTGTCAETAAYAVMCAWAVDARQFAAATGLPEPDVPWADFWSALHQLTTEYEGA